MFVFRPNQSQFVSVCSRFRRILSIGPSTHHCVDGLALGIDQLLVAHPIGEDQIDVEHEADQNDGQQSDHQVEVEHVAEHPKTAKRKKGKSKMD